MTTPARGRVAVTVILRHWAPMTMGSDGKFSSGPTKAKCGLEIPDVATRGPWPNGAHSNVAMHVTCEDCLAAADFVAPDRRDPRKVEAWLSS